MPRPDGLPTSDEREQIEVTAYRAEREREALDERFASLETRIDRLERLVDGLVAALQDTVRLLRQ